jgi:hypothetical protein
MSNSNQANPTPETAECATLNPVAARMLWEWLRDVIAMFQAHDAAVTARADGDRSAGHVDTPVLPRGK